MQQRPSLRIERLSTTGRGHELEAGRSSTGWVPRPCDRRTSSGLPADPGPRDRLRAAGRPRSGPRLRHRPRTRSTGPARLRVTGVDPVPPALDRARGSAADTGVRSAAVVEGDIGAAGTPRPAAATTLLLIDLGSAALAPGRCGARPRSARRPGGRARPTPLPFALLARGGARRRPAGWTRPSCAPPSRAGTCGPAGRPPPSCCAARSAAPRRPGTGSSGTEPIGRASRDADRSGPAASRSRRARTAPSCPRVGEW